MKNTLNIGTLKLPKTSATKGFAFIGKRGSGKSYNAAVFAEELHKAGVPFVVFDPIDVWWGLKVAADSKGKGLPVVVFGLEHADILLDRTMGKKIAQAVVKDNVSCVISTFGLSKQAMREIVTDFSEELLRINNTPRQVIIEEAHEYVPQRVMGAAAKCFSAVEALIVMGRNRGIGVTLLNQRMATINKDVISQIDTLFMSRSVGPQDRKALSDWAMGHDATKEEFAHFFKEIISLPTGDAWLWSPEFLEKFVRVTFRKRETFHPDREKLGTTFKMPEIRQGDLQAFIEAFSKKPTQAQSDQKKAVNAPFQQKNVQSDPKTLEKAVSKAVGDRDAYWRKEIERERASWRKLTDHLDKRIYDASGILNMGASKRPDVYLAGGQKVVAPKFEQIKMPAAPKGVQSGLLKREVFNPPIHVTSDGTVSKPEQRVLDSIAWFNLVGNHAPRKEAVAILAGVRPTSGGYKNTCGSLRSRGLLDYPEPNYIALTDEGKLVAHVEDTDISSNDAFHRVVLSRLSMPEQNVLRPLLEDWREIGKDDLASLTPYLPTSGGFKNILGTLRTMGFIDYPRPGTVKAEPLMFPFES